MNFRDLRVYQTARETARLIFHASRKFPPEERYSLTDQIRRSSRSVCTNIAEAWRKRRHPACFVSKLSDSDAEAAETQVWLESALDGQYIDNRFFVEVSERYDHICAQLTTMMDHPEQWALRARSPRIADKNKEASADTP